MQENRIIRKTSSVCPVCLAKISADIIEHEGSVYMKKTCAQHGVFELLLSRHSDYYKELDDFYFSLMDKSFQQRDYIVHLTNRCNINCPICLADANMQVTEDYPLESLKEFLKGKRGYKLDLMGAEPTLRDDLPEIIKIVTKSGNIAALHTNGIRITDYSYLKKLKKAGLNEAHLQFDGFDDEVYEKIRGQRLLSGKMKALENLERLNIATDLVVTIVRGFNEKEMIKVMDFGTKHVFIKEIFFLGCRFLGKARDLPLQRCMMPDELIDILEEQAQGKISRQGILRFQKLYFSLLAAFSIRKCSYIHHFLIVRDKENYVPIDRILDLKSLERKLEKFKGLKSAKNKWALPYLLYFLGISLINFRSLFFLRELLSFSFPFIKGFDLSKLPRKGILLGFISACDAYSLDYAVARNCGKGAISVELGVQDTGAVDNVLRDRLTGGRPE